MNTATPAVVPAPRRRLRGRALVTLVTAVSFTMMVLSGVMLYIAPRGRLANWDGWSMLGLQKNQWSDLHMTMAVVLLIAMVFHLYYNWKPLCHYLQSSTARLGVRWRELMIAGALVLAVAAGTLAGVWPFDVIPDANERIKNHWEAKTIVNVDTDERSGRGGGTGHYGRLTLGQFCDAERMSLDETLQWLSHRAIHATQQTPLHEIAHDLNITPREAAILLRRGEEGSSGEFTPRR